MAPQSVNVKSELELANISWCRRIERLRKNPRREVLASDVRQVAIAFLAPDIHVELAAAHGVRLQLLVNRCRWRERHSAARDQTLLSQGEQRCLYDRLTGVLHQRTVEPRSEMDSRESPHLHVVTAAAQLV